MDLSEVVNRVAAWAAEKPLIRQVTLFGSHVRGDHQPNSNLGVHIERHGGEINQAENWERQEKTDFVELRAQFPFCLTISIDYQTGQTARYIAAGKKVREYTVGKVVCVETKEHPKDHSC